MAAVLFAEQANVKVQYIPYKGANDANLALIAGQLTVSFLDIAPATTAQVSITLALGRMLQISDRNRESLEVFDRTRARLGATDRSAALTLEGTVEDLVHAIHAHPTLSEGVHEALEGVFGAPIHL